MASVGPGGGQNSQLKKVSRVDYFREAKIIKK